MSRSVNRGRSARLFVSPSDIHGFVGCRSVCCIVLVSSAFLNILSVAHGETLARDSSATLASVCPKPGVDGAIRVGDKLKLGFYEILENDESKWRGPAGRSAMGARDFHERTELSAEYVVQEDGSISIPLMGVFAAAGQTKPQIIDKLTFSLKELLGRSGYVNLLSVERRPIYIVGAIKNQGALKFEPNMTVLHAVAEAGGLRRAEIESWQTVEARRQMVALEKSLEKAKRLIARTVVLQPGDKLADNNAKTGLVSLIGNEDSKLLIQQETSQVRLSEMNRSIRRTALEAAVTNNRAELSARSGRIAPFDESIKLRTERVKGLEQLVDKNLITRAGLIQAQSELSELQDRRQQAVLDTEATRQKLNQSEQELARYWTESRLDIEQAVAAAERETADAITETEGSLNVLKSFGDGTAAAIGDGSVSFELVCSGPDGVKVSNVVETTLLQPGDLVRVKANGSGS